MADRSAGAGGTGAPRLLGVLPGVLPGVLLGALLWVPPASASEAAVTWPTFFRLGPGKQYRVVEELARGTVLDVVSCTDQWCQVGRGRTVGYVDRAALEPPPWQAGTAAAPPGAPTGQACFESRRAGYGEGERFLYCPR